MRVHTACLLQPATKSVETLQLLLRVSKLLLQCLSFLNFNLKKGDLLLRDSVFPVAVDKVRV